MKGRREVLSSLSQRLHGTFCSPSKTAKLLSIVIVVLSSLGFAWLVYATGGVKYATLHTMYLPIIVAALVFGATGGIITGILAGLLAGPYMPIDTTTGEAQQLGNWLLRMGFFCAFGGIVGFGAGTLRRQLNLLDWLNEHDGRTGMLNRTGLLRELRQRIERGGDEAQVFLIVVQIKNLLDIQNTLAPPSARSSSSRSASAGGRLCLPTCRSRSSSATASPSSSTTVRRPASCGPTSRRRFALPTLSTRCPCTFFAFGAAQYPEHARTVEELLQKASIAMHTAVTRKRSFHLYDSARDLTSRENLVLLGMIPAAIANNEFVIWHQAKLSLATGRTESTEALLRWAHPQRGLIPPGNFIPQAEESALVNDVTQWVIDAALADKAAWTARGHSMSVAINLSVRNLHRRFLLDTLHKTVCRYGIDPQQVELEITESAVMDDFEYCAALVARLRDRGYRVSIDDFGTGHSSLAYLKKLPVSALKIDQAFVKRLAHDNNDQKIVRAILGLARSLDLESVAEGVEDDAALALLREWGCDYAQGYAVHRPAPYDQLLAWIEQAPRRSAPAA
ncbi:MAG: EAL domain-containing protein [Hyphomicrobiaceae bacterium]